jgi:methionyl-tRNA synthetase
MAKAKPYFITTAIDYVNAAPHIGHAYEKVLGDVVARWHRLQDEKVHFLTGTDEKQSEANPNRNRGEKSFTSTQLVIRGGNCRH